MSSRALLAAEARYRKTLAEYQAALDEQDKAEKALKAAQAAAQAAWNTYQAAVREVTELERGS